MRLSNELVYSGALHCGDENVANAVMNIAQPCPEVEQK